MARSRSAARCPKSCSGPSTPKVNAKLQSEAMKLGPVTYLSPEEAEKAAATIDGQTARPWELWKRKALGH
jgi:hypothetical protein